jgi:hypothetical protein
MGGADQGESVRRLLETLPEISIWLDGGFRDGEGSRAWGDAGRVVPVLGSETIRDANCLASWPNTDLRGDSEKSVVIPAKAGIQLDPESGEETRLDPGLRRGDDCGLGDDRVREGAPILSLDFDAQGFRGAPAILGQTERWPGSVIVMTLDRVGEDSGPDLVRLRSIVARAGGRRVIAAGGVRNIADIEAIADCGAAGALVASALHEKRIGQKEIAAFRRRRRSL